MVGWVAAKPWVGNPKPFLFCIFWFRNRKDHSVNFCTDPGQFTYSLFASGSLSVCPREEFQMERPLLALHLRVCAGGWGVEVRCCFPVYRGNRVFGGSFLANSLPGG